MSDADLASELLASICEGGLLVSDSGVIIEANSAMQRILGHSPKELVGKKVSVLCADPDGRFEKLVGTAAETLRFGNPWHHQLTGRRKDGSKLALGVCAMLISLRKQRHLLLLFRDITQQEKAGEAAAWLAAIVQASDDAIIGGIPDGTITSWNPGAERLYGWKAEEAIGRNLSFLEASTGEMMKIVNTVKKQKAILHYEAKRRRKDGSLVDVSISVNPIIGTNGEVVGGCSIARDITEKRRADEALRESEGRFRMLCELSPAGIFRTDPSGRCVYVNARWCEMAGRTPDQAWKDGIAAAIHPDDLPTMSVEWARAVKEGRPFETEFRFLRPDGGVTWAIGQAVPEKRDDGVLTGYIGNVTDITERKRAEEDLKRTEKELRASNRSLDGFAYVISHDLQEPLRMVTSYLHLLENRYRGRLDKVALEFLRFAEDGAQRMREMINGVLAYSRVGGKGGQFQPTDLSLALGEALANLRVALQESGARLTWDSLPVVPADKTLIVQLFQNLIGNALKFRGSSLPEIRIGAVRRDGFWELTVKDNGIGFAMGNAERIFLMFQRLHGRDEYPGIGVGLAICKRIVEYHHGEIWAESEPSKGARFCFTLPV